MKKSICLNMIVKNESRVIRRCLESVKRIIDHWVIVDTGSSDGTQEVVRETMLGIPGELYERPWVDFAANRNEAMKLAKGKGDFLLFIDADEWLRYDEGFSLSNLDQDLYLVPVQLKDGVVHHRATLVDNHAEWEWEGVVHEDLFSREGRERCGVLPGVLNVSRYEGDRSKDPKKYLKDAQALEAALKKDPGDLRTAFYLAQSYRDAKEHALAEKSYGKILKMGAPDEVVYCALYWMGRLREILDGSLEEVAEGYLRAYRFRTSRAEPLCWLARYLYSERKVFLSYLISKFGLRIPVPKRESLSVEYPVYDYYLLWIYASAAMDLGRRSEAKEAFGALLQRPNIPEGLLAEMKRDAGCVF